MIELETRGPAHLDSIRGNLKRDGCGFTVAALG